MREMTAFNFELVIGDKNWSSWSLRPWLAMRQAGLPFYERSIRLRQPDTKAQILPHSPAGTVPALKWNGIVIAESLAILETIADLFPAKRLWPEDVQARAMARAASAEMHAGFMALRREMPMDILNRYPGQGHTEEALNDARRVVAIWREARLRFGKLAEADEGFLFGRFGVADAMYAPVVTRFETYGVDPAALGEEDGTARAYMDAVLRLPAMQEWTAEARQEMEERGLL